jgi:hypothetical protein
MSAYSHHEHDKWVSTDEELDTLYDPDVDYRLCDCAYSENEEGDPVWHLCGICKLADTPAARAFPREVAYIHTAVARFHGTQNKKHKEFLARTLLRYFANEALDLLGTSYICRNLVRSKCSELEESDLGGSLTKEIAAAREAAEEKELHAFKLIL